MDFPTNRLWREATRGVLRDTAFTVAVVAIVLTILALWATSPAHGAEPKPPPSYAEAAAIAQKTGKTLVLYVAYKGPVMADPPAGAVVAYSAEPFGGLSPGIYLSKWLSDGTHRGMRLPPEVYAKPGTRKAAIESFAVTLAHPPVAAPACYTPQPVQLQPSVIVSLRSTFFGGS